MARGWWSDIPNMFMDLSVEILKGAAQMAIRVVYGGELELPSQRRSKVPQRLSSGELPIGHPIGRRTTVFLPADDSRHKIVQGASGAGKTEWAINYVINRAHLGQGTAYLDNTDGVAAHRILNGLPEASLEKTVVLDYSREDFPLPLGFYASSGRASDVDLMTSWWIWFFTENLGIEGQWMTQELIAYSCKAVFSVPGTTFYEVIEMVRDERVRHWILEQLDPDQHEDTLDWWSDFNEAGEKKQQFIVESFMRRARLITSQVVLRNMLYQSPRNPYPYRTWMDEGYIVLIIAPESLGSLVTRTVMSLHMLNLWATTLYRDSDQNQSKRNPFMVVADEPQTWLGNNEQIIDDIFSKGRKYGLGMTCLFQEASQLDRGNLLRILLGNQPDLILFKCDDNSPIKITGHKLSELDRYQFWARIGDEEPIKLRALGVAPKEEDRRKWARDHVRQWGRPAQEVAQEIRRRKQAWRGEVSISGKTSKSPKTGSNPTASPASRDEISKSFDSSLRIG